MTDQPVVGIGTIGVVNEYTAMFLNEGMAGYENRIVSESGHFDGGNDEPLFFLTVGPFATREDAQAAALLQGGSIRVRLG